MEAMAVVTVVEKEAVRTVEKEVVRAVEKEVVTGEVAVRVGVRVERGRWWRWRSARYPHRAPRG